MMTSTNPSSLPLPTELQRPPHVSRMALSYLFPMIALMCQSSQLIRQSVDHMLGWYDINKIPIPTPSQLNYNVPLTWVGWLSATCFQWLHSCVNLVNSLDNLLITCWNDMTSTKSPSSLPPPNRTTTTPLTWVGWLSATCFQWLHSCVNLVNSLDNLLITCWDDMTSTKPPSLPPPQLNYNVPLTWVGWLSATCFHWLHSCVNLVNSLDNLLITCWDDMTSTKPLITTPLNWTTRSPLTWVGWLSAICFQWLHSWVSLVTSFDNLLISCCDDITSTKSLSSAVRAELLKDDVEVLLDKPASGPLVEADIMFWCRSCIACCCSFNPLISSCYETEHFKQTLYNSWVTVSHEQ